MVPGQVRQAARGVAPDARKALGAYYTPPSLAEAMLAYVPAPRLGIVDLACGDGVWLAAAARRWPGVPLHGVDIDPQAVAAARRRLGPAAELGCADGAGLRGRFDLVVGNPPWGAGRVGPVRRGDESVSRFVDGAIDNLVTGGRLCLLVPAAWLEVAAHRTARRRLLNATAVERVEHLGDVFAGVNAPAALVVARREPDDAARERQWVMTPRGPLAQAWFADDRDCVLNPRLSARERALVAKLEAQPERLVARVRFILGVVTGDNRRALGATGEPIVTGTDIAPMQLAPPRRCLSWPLAAVQQAAPRAAYARPKIVYRFVHAHPLAAVDRDGRLTLNSANAMAIDDDTLALDWVAAWLNSSCVRWLHRARHAMPRVLRSHLERLPLPAMSPALRRAASEAALAGEEALRDRLIMDAFALDDDERAWVSACPRS
jgi:restriction endonuclease TaqI-like protein/methyltransferase family protein